MELQARDVVVVKPNQESVAWQAYLTAARSYLKSRNSIPEDLEMVLEVNEIARALTAIEFNHIAPYGARLDRGEFGNGVRGHQPKAMEKWREACAMYEEITGIDGQEALARHEAAIRANNPVLNR